jgi:epoxyqueuosine reductase
VKDYCGTCTRCIDACPTDAILAPYEIDGSKCISYYTIELKEKIPEDAKNKFDNWIFGCDACQDVCPWNRFSKPNNVIDFQPKESLFALSERDFEDITEETFEKVFNGTPLRRAGYQGLLRNINFVKQK